jgi:hypothetical protein
MRLDGRRGSPFTTMARGFGLASALLALAGCESVKSGLSGSAATEAATEQAAAAAGTTANGPIRVDFDPATECPQINVPAGTSAYASYAGGQDSANVRFQARISNFARECTLLPGNMVGIKVGVQGLVILGEKGAPGTYPAPLRIAVRDRDGTVVSEQRPRLSVTIPPGADQGTFKIVESSFSVPISFEKPLRSFDIEVGFDQGGGAAEPRKKKRG